MILQQVFANYIDKILFLISPIYSPSPLSASIIFFHYYILFALLTLHFLFYHLISDFQGL